MYILIEITIRGEEWKFWSEKKIDSKLTEEKNMKHICGSDRICWGLDMGVL